MSKIIVLDIEMCYGTIKDMIHPVVLCDQSNKVLVDCGFVGALPQIEEALLLNNLSADQITHIILTHQDHDHVGAAAAFKSKYPQVQVMASHIEAPYISGAEKSLRLIQAEQLQDNLPPEQKAFGEAFTKLLQSVEPVKVDKMLFPDENLPFCGGCEVVFTQGHTPGHISLYLPEFQVVITGDAIALEEGKPVIANPQFTLDLKEAEASMQQLLAYKANKVICYHGGVYRM